MTGVSSLEWANQKECHFIGLPKLYIPETKYTFAITSNYIVSRKIYVSSGVVIGSSKSGANKSPEATTAIEKLAAQSAAGTEAKTEASHDHSAHAHRQLTDSKGTCFDCNRPTHGAVLYDWISPAKSTGAVLFSALCGGSSIGNGAAGFVKIAALMEIKETYKHTTTMGHTCTDATITALDEYEMSGLKIKDEEAARIAAGGIDSGQVNKHEGMAMVFSQWKQGALLQILFEGWNVTNTGSYVGTLIAMFVLGASVRLLRIPLADLVKKQEIGIGSNWCFGKLIIWLSFFVLQALSYWVMLATMSYDVGLFVVILAGMSSGFVVENHILTKRRKKNGSNMKQPREMELPNSPALNGTSNSPPINVREEEEDQIEAKFGDCCEIDFD